MAVSCASPVALGGGGSPPPTAFPRKRPNGATSRSKRPPKNPHVPQRAASRATPFQATAPVAKKTTATASAAPTIATPRIPRTTARGPGGSNSSTAGTEDSAGGGGRLQPPPRRLKTNTPPPPPQ